MKWTKETAMAEIDSLAEQTHVLQSLKRNCEEHIRWIAKTRRFLSEVFGEESTYFVTFASLTWSKQGSYVIGGPGCPNESFNPQLGINRVNQEAYVQQLEVARAEKFSALPRETRQSKFKVRIFVKKSSDFVQKAPQTKRS